MACGYSRTVRKTASAISAGAHTQAAPVVVIVVGCTSCIYAFCSPRWPRSLKMLSFEEKLKSLVVQLYDINALKFGDYKMKIGINSPVYFDLRVIVSYPEVMESLSFLLYEFARADFNCDHICGVPYTALPISTIIAVHSKTSMLLRRKESKSYGTGKMIEGKFNPGDTCIIVEDVVTSGSSILETVRDLEREGLKVTTAVVTVDRQQGGAKNLADKGVTMRSLTSLTEIMEILHEAGKVDEATVKSVKSYIAESQVRPDGSFVNAPPKAVMQCRMTTPYSERAKVAINTTSVKLLTLMAGKRSNLCVAADLTSADDVLTLAREVGAHICLFKTHADIIQDFTKDFVKELQSIAEEHNFMIMEDRKFSDIGHLVGLQYSSGVHAIAGWADIVTAHPVSGDGVLTGLKAAAKKASQGRGRSCFLVAEMSSEGNLNSPEYIAASMKMAADHEDFISGIVCQSPNVIHSPGLLQLTPGCRLPSKEAGDGLGQRYNTPERVVLEGGADIAVVGRGITEAGNRGKEAAIYRELLWAAYEKRVQKE